ncbi:hypothetical protein Tco_0818945 [Tanacetum coccineum]
MSADVARGHGGDGGSDDRPPPYQAPTGCGGCLGNRGKGTRKPFWVARSAGQGAYSQEDPEPRLQFNLRPTLIPIDLGHNLCGHPAAFAKDLTKQECCSKGIALAP